MIIDMHHHLASGDDYLDKLTAEYRRLGIAKVCLFGADEYDQKGV